MHMVLSASFLSGVSVSLLDEFGMAFVWIRGQSHSPNLDRIVRNPKLAQYCHRSF